MKAAGKHEHRAHTRVAPPRTLTLSGEGRAVVFPLAALILGIPRNILVRPAMVWGGSRGPLGAIVSQEWRRKG